MQKMNTFPFYTTYSLKHAAIKKLVRLKMELSKINAKFALNPTVIFGYYSPTSNEETIVTLIEKNIESQKEKIKKLITLDKEYEEMFRDEKIEKLVRIEEIVQKKKNLKFKKFSSVKYPDSYCRRVYK
jgi:hypothetical protein